MLNLFSLNSFIRIIFYEGLLLCSLVHFLKVLVSIQLMNYTLSNVPIENIIKKNGNVDDKRGLVKDIKLLHDEIPRYFIILSFVSS